MRGRSLLNDFLVSIPDRYAKNLVKLFTIFFIFLVSIPDRYAKNSGLPSIPASQAGVSIPDRYAKNASMLRDTEIFELSFNS